MKLLGSPAGLAVCALLLAVAVHPLAGLEDGETAGTAAVSILAMLFTVAAILRAVDDRRTAVVAIGSSLLLVAVAYDALRGHEGALTLRAGQARQSFEERGPGGASLGLRPLGVPVSLETLLGGSASLAIGEGAAARREALRPERAVEVGPFRLGWTRLVPHPRLAIGITRGGAVQAVEISDEEGAAAGDLHVELERYFPDFALDEKNQPYSRSNEPTNPGALLRVQRGRAQWRVLVLRAVPDIHGVPDLGATFSMRGLADDPELAIAVHHQPAAPAAAAGAVVVAVGLLLLTGRGRLAGPAGMGGAIAVALAFVVWALLRGGMPVPVFFLTAAGAAAAAALAERAWGRRLEGDRPLAAVLAAAMAAVLLSVTGGGDLLQWRLAAGRVEMPGPGLVAGLLLLACIGGAAILGADRLCPGASAIAPRLGRALLLFGVAFGVIAVGLVVKEALSAEARSWAALAPAGGAIAGATWLLALGVGAVLSPPRAAPPSIDDVGPGRLAAIAAALTVAALLAAGVGAWQAQASYAALPARHVLAAALAGIAAAQPTRFPMLRVVLFLGAVAVAIAAQVS